jgi:hypothetical protein
VAQVVYVSRDQREDVAALVWLKSHTTPNRPAPVPREHRAGVRRLARRGEAVIRVAEEQYGVIVRARLYAAVP